MESEIRDRLRLPTRQGGFGLLATGKRAPASFIVATARALPNIDFIMPDAASNANPYDVAVMNALRQVKEELEKLMIEKKSLAPFDNWTKFKARCVKARGEEYWVHELYTMARLARVVGRQPRGMGAGADEKKGGEEVKADGKQAISQKHIIEACGSSGMLFLDAHLIDQWTQLSNEEFCHVVRMHLNVDGQSYCPMCNQKVGCMSSGVECAKWTERSCTLDCRTRWRQFTDWLVCTLLASGRYFCPLFPKMAHDA